MTSTFLNADINGLTTFIIDIAAIVFLASAFAIISISIAAGLSGLFRFGRGGNGVLQQGGRGLHGGHSSSNDVLRNGVRHDGRRDRRNLHQSTLSTSLRKLIKILFSTRSLSTFAYIIAYTE